MNWSTDKVSIRRKSAIRPEATWGYHSISLGVTGIVCTIDATRYHYRLAAA